MTQPPPPELGYLKFHLQGNAMLSWVVPSVQIDGYPVPAKYGDNVYPVHPGPHAVSAHGQALWKYGAASFPFQVGPGESAEVWYAAPALVFLRGAIGPTRQRVPGVLALVLFLVVVVALVVLAVLL
jgi:hypothetical protein